MKRACRLWTPEEIATLRHGWVKGSNRARSYARRSLDNGKFSGANAS